MFIDVFMMPLPRRAMPRYRFHAAAAATPPLLPLML